jgi:hypothetical protein
MTEFDDWEGFDEASQAYLDAFGEAPPRMTLPPAPADALAAIRAALAAGRPYEAAIPVDANT